MHNSIYDYSPITERPRFEWPGGKKVAFYAAVAVEHYPVDKPSTSIFAGTAGLTPDPLNYGWRDYGMRVGIWRMIESLDRHGMRAAAAVNSDACSLYPQVIAAGNERQVVITWGEINGGSRKPQVEKHQQTEIRATVASAPYATAVQKMKREAVGAR